MKTTRFVIPASFSVIPTCSESLLKKDSGQARMTNGQAGMTENRVYGQAIVEYKGALNHGKI